MKSCRGGEQEAIGKTRDKFVLLLLVCSIPLDTLQIEWNGKLKE